MESRWLLWRTLQRVLGKEASWSLVERLGITNIVCCADTSCQRFYYADERTPEGLPVMREIDGMAAGKVYLDLAEDPEQKPWNYTYTKDYGYEDFNGGEYLTVRGASTAESMKGGRD